VTNAEALEKINKMPWLCRLGCHKWRILYASWTSKIAVDECTRLPCRAQRTRVLDEDGR
jgi:hypothetical protein